MLDILIHTLMKRPYVAAFFISYLFIASKSVNFRWALIFVPIGFVIAFFSEYLSINYGFPYGWYHYIYENLEGELLLAGVPTWDSLSYVFMTYAGLSLASITLYQKAPFKSIKSKFYLVILAAFFTTLLDVIIDPISHLGEHWFLGKIYYYPEPGFYFDITMANFAGWFITTFLISGAVVFFTPFLKWETLSKHSASTERVPCSAKNLMKMFWRRPDWLSMGLYYGIMGFGVSITIYLGEWFMLFCHVFWITLTVVIRKTFQKN
jgi:uncharacterized membrane protein